MADDNIPNRVAELEQIVSDTASVLADIRSELRGLRSDLHTDISDLHASISGLRTDLRDIRQGQRADVRWLLGLYLAGTAAILGVVVHGFLAAVTVG
jgi:hypothetical protein